MVIKHMYEGAVMSVRTTCRDNTSVSSDHRFATLHKGLALSPYFFGLIIDELTAHVKESTLMYTVCR